MLHFEDFPVGEVKLFGDRLVTAEEIVAFARQFDPQPFHLDAEAARGSQAGSLIASGWHTGVLLMRMCCDAYLLDTASEGAPGCEEIKWIKSVRPNDHLHVRRTTLAARASGSRPTIGIVSFLFEVFNQNDEIVMSQKNPVFIRRREAAEASS
jgi:acyl dehydratase